MFDWIISCSVLIIIFVFLRFIFKNKVSAKFQYSLWLIVLIRLLVPFNLFSSSFSLQNLFHSRFQYDYYFANELPLINTGFESFWETVPEAAGNINDTIASDGPLFTVWIMGIIVFACVLLISNLHFYLKVRHSREAVEKENYPLKVFVCSLTANPCLYGVIKPNVYMARGDFEDEKKRAHILAHEYTHYKHHDNLWSLLRCVCVILHWYNPLVWLAAILSKADAEFACDESTVKLFSSENKNEYGRTIIDLSAKEQHKGLFFAPAAALYGKAMLKQRIKRLTRQKKTAVAAVIVVALVCVATVGFVFSEAKKETVEIPVTIGENVQAGYEVAVYEYAADCVTDRIEELAKSGVTVKEANITGIEYIPTGNAALFHCIDTYRLSYELRANGEIPQELDVTVNENGYITEQTSKGDTYFILIDTDSLIGMGEVEYPYYRAGQFTTADMEAILAENNQNLQGVEAISYATLWIYIQTGYDTMIGDAYDIAYLYN
ncbi:MAG: M56 family metallopeptidase [Clostridia bacterium]|nr:M56 family metallopeptidase [Clostridia bacterium]